MNAKKSKKCKPMEDHEVMVFIIDHYGLNSKPPVG